MDSTEIFKLLPDIPSDIKNIMENESDWESKYSIGQMYILVCLMTLKKTDASVYLHDVEFKRLQEQWDKEVLVPYAKAIKSFLEAHPECTQSVNICGCSTGNAPSTAIQMGLVTKILEKGLNP